MSQTKSRGGMHSNTTANTVNKNRRDCDNSPAARRAQAHTNSLI